MGDAWNQQKSQKNNHKLDSQNKGQYSITNIESTHFKHMKYMYMTYYIKNNYKSNFLLLPSRRRRLSRSYYIVLQNIRQQKTRQYRVTTIDNTNESIEKFRYVSRKVQVFSLWISHPTGKFNETVNIKPRSKNK